jgi:nucleotide-binding universal stress UspA family protein
VRRDYNEEALVQLQDLVPASFTGPWKTEVATGDPANAIVQAAQDLGVDLIVMATHGRTGLQHVFLGSVAEKVIRHAPCPVLAIRYRAATV